MKTERMVLKVPADIQMAIRLAAAKTLGTNASVVISLVEKGLAVELAEARKVLGK